MNTTPTMTAEVALGWLDSMTECDCIPRADGRHLGPCQFNDRPAVDALRAHLTALEARREALEADAGRYAFVIARHPLAFQRLVTGTTANGPIHRKDLIDAAIDTARKESEG